MKFDYLTINFALILCTSLVFSCNKISETNPMQTINLSNYSDYKIKRVYELDSIHILIALEKTGIEKDRLKLLIYNTSNLELVKDYKFSGNQDVFFSDGLIFLSNIEANTCQYFNWKEEEMSLKTIFKDNVVYSSPYYSSSEQLIYLPVLNNEGIAIQEFSIITDSIMHSIQTEKFDYSSQIAQVYFLDNESVGYSLFDSKEKTSNVFLKNFKSDSILYNQNGFKDSNLEISFSNPLISIREKNNGRGVVCNIKSKKNLSESKFGNLFSLSTEVTLIQENNKVKLLNQEGSITNEFELEDNFQVKKAIVNKKELSLLSEAHGKAKLSLYDFQKKSKQDISEIEKPRSYDYYSTPDFLLLNDYSNQLHVFRK